MYLSMCCIQVLLGERYMCQSHTHFFSREPFKKVFRSNCDRLSVLHKATYLLLFAHICCRNLLDCDVFSKSDPMCVTYLRDFEMMEWQEVARTETINNTLNPNFTKKVRSGKL
jgi:hypothetical protein